MVIGLIATPELPEFYISATVTNYKMNLTFFPVAQLSIQLKSSRDLCMCAVLLD